MSKPIDLHAYDDTKGRGACRSCHAKIEWYELHSGRKHPIDADSVPVRSYHEEDTGRLVLVFSSDDSHFASCPDSQKWSRKA